MQSHCHGTGWSHSAAHNTVVESLARDSAASWSASSFVGLQRGDICTLHQAWHQPTLAQHSLRRHIKTIVVFCFFYRTICRIHIGSFYLLKFPLAFFSCSCSLPFVSSLSTSSLLLSFRPRSSGSASHRKALTLQLSAQMHRRICFPKSRSTCSSGLSSLSERHFASEHAFLFSLKKRIFGDWTLPVGRDGTTCVCSSRGMPQVDWPSLRAAEATQIYGLLCDTIFVCSVLEEDWKWMWSAGHLYGATWGNDKFMA